MLVHHFKFVTFSYPIYIFSDEKEICLLKELCEGDVFILFYLSFFMMYDRRKLCSL